MPLGVLLARVGEASHQVVLGVDVDEEIPRVAAERLRVFHQRRQLRDAPLPFDVVDRRRILRAELFRQREDRSPFPQLLPQRPKAVPVCHVARIVRR